MTEHNRLSAAPVFIIDVDVRSVFFSDSHVGHKRFRFSLSCTKQSATPARPNPTKSSVCYIRCQRYGCVTGKAYSGRGCFKIRSKKLHQASLVSLGCSSRIQWPVSFKTIIEVAAEPLICLTREVYPNYYDFLSIIFSKVKQKPRVIEEHDSMSGVMSAVEAGTGVAVAVDFGYSFGNRVKFLHLTPEPKPFSVGIVARKGKLSPAAERFWQCAKQVAALTVK